jgi:hypothetical protein
MLEGNGGGKRDQFNNYEEMSPHIGRMKTKYNRRN